ncbi:cobalamin biosynthesis protein, partial [Patescibacteria group bacterium]|nr:cobalamin biosynthesis protein [Patescibacteria group bacterium]
MDFSTSWYVLPAAVILDLAIGDPDFLPHPIRWMGKAVSFLEPVFRKLPAGLTLSGAFFAAFLIAGTWFVAAWSILAAKLIHPLARSGLEI